MSAFPTIQFWAADAVLAFPSSQASADIHLAALKLAGWLNRQQLKSLTNLVIREVHNGLTAQVLPPSSLHHVKETDMTKFEQAAQKSGLTTVQYLGVHNQIFMDLETATMRAFGWTYAQLAELPDTDPRKVYFDDTVEAMKSTLLMRAAERE
jgi:hypothetical protein